MNVQSIPVQGTKLGPYDSCNSSKVTCLSTESDIIFINVEGAGETRPNGPKSPSVYCFIKFVIKIKESFTFYEYFHFHLN